MGLLKSIFGDKSNNQEPQDYLVSYQRSVVYEDGTKDARLELDERFDNVVLEELVDRIENNQKTLTCREDDVIDFSKDIFLTELGYIIKDADGKIVHNSGKSHEIAIAFNFIEDADEWVQVFEAIGEPIEDPDNPDFDELEVKLKNSFSKIMNYISEGFGSDQEEASYVEPGEHDEYAIFRFSLGVPFYAYNDYLCKLSQILGQFTVLTLNSEVELVQIYTQGRVDEGMAKGHDWEYMMEDYGNLIMDFLDE